MKNLVSLSITEENLGLSKAHKSILDEHLAELHQSLENCLTADELKNAIKRE